MIDLSGQTELIDNYFAMWTSTQDTERHELVERIWAPEASYTDPLTTVDGPRAIEVMVSAVAERLPGVTFRRTGTIDAHSGFLRYQWEMFDADGTRLRTGVSFGEVTPAGKLRRLVGFFD